MWLWGSVSLILFVPCFLFFLGFWLSMANNITREKRSSYECGFEAIWTARRRFSLRFFLLCVLFVVFDVEIVLIVPILYSMGGVYFSVSLICSILFVLVLVLGCLYERRDGSMDWIREL